MILCEEKLFSLVVKSFFSDFIGLRLLNSRKVSKNWVAAQIMTHDHLIDLLLDLLSEALRLLHAVGEWQFTGLFLCFGRLEE